MNPILSSPRIWWAAAFAVVTAGIVTAALRPARDADEPRAALTKVVQQPAATGTGAAARVPPPDRLPAGSRLEGMPDGAGEELQDGQNLMGEVTQLRDLLDLRADRKDAPAPPVRKTVERPPAPFSLPGPPATARRGALSPSSASGRTAGGAHSTARWSARAAHAAPGAGSKGLFGPASPGAKAHPSRAFYRRFGNRELNAMIQRRQGGASLADACRSASSAATCIQAAEACGKDKDCGAWLAAEGGIGAATEGAKSAGPGYAAENGKGQDAKGGSGARPGSSGGGFSSRSTHEVSKLETIRDPGKERDGGFFESIFASMDSGNRKRIEAYYDAHCIQAPVADAVCEIAQICVELDLYAECVDTCAKSPACKVPWPKVEPGKLCDTQTYFCSARYGGHEFEHLHGDNTVMAFQSCLFPADLDTTGCKETLVGGHNYDEPLHPQVWLDNHECRGQAWKCSRRLGGYQYPDAQKSFPVKYLTSCSKDQPALDLLRDKGYEYAGRTGRARDGVVGEWKDTHAMKTCCPGSAPCPAAR
ncbi:MAG: hypothetical protein HY554_18640 [Elusimicrobia bacterium]|nr:hypothetical protein [Elusimicrobiota bacterium]